MTCAGFRPRPGLLLASIAALAATAAATGAPLVECIDHVYLPADDARALHSVLRDSLGLPEVWAFGSHGGGISGGISLGNVVLEFLERADAPVGPIEGLALWPQVSAEDVQRKLRAVGMGSGRPLRMQPAASVTGAGWIIMGLADFPEANVFVCEYLDAAGVRQGRERASAALAEISGGALGVIRVREIVIGARDPATQRARWRQLAEPGNDEPLVRFGRGPAVRVVSAERDAVLALVVEVRDPARAAAVWPRALRHLPIRFVGSSSTGP